MMRRGLILLVTLALCVTGLTLAQTPATPGEDEPPLQLKKKPRNQGDEKKEPGNPEKPPENPPQLKPEEPERLDPRDQIQQTPPEENLQDVLERLMRNSRASEDRLANREVGKGTLNLQDELLKDLDALIAVRNQNQNQNQNQNSGQSKSSDPSRGQSGMQRGSSGDSNPSGNRDYQEARRRRQERLSRRQAEEQLAQRQRPQPRPSTGQENPGGGSNSENAVTAKKPLSERDYNLLMHLLETKRATQNTQARPEFMEKYDGLTWQYFRKISEKSGRQGK